MANLTPTPGWDNIPQLDKDTRALGGPGGPMNAQAQALLNRTEAIAQATVPDAGTLTGAEFATVSRGSGVLKTTLTAIAQWVLQTYQGYTAPFASAMSRTQRDKNNDTVSIDDCAGLDPTGATVSSSANLNAFWADAVSKGKRAINWGDGTYKFNDTLTGPPIMHRGAGTTIIFENFSGKNGITFTPATRVGAQGGMTGFELVAKGQNGAVGVQMPKQSDQYDTYFTKWTFRGLYCRGYTRNAAAYSFAWDYGFAKWFSLSDCVGLEFDHSTIQGQWDIQLDPAIQFQDAHIELDAASALLTARLSNLNLCTAHTAVRWGDRSFFSLVHCDLIGVHRGVYQTGTTMFNEPKIHHCNINAQDAGVYFSGPGSIDIDSVTIRRHSSGWKGGSAVWDGLRILNGSDLKIRACTIQPDESAGAFTGTMTAINLQACSLVVLEGNFIGVGNDNGITLDNCTGVVAASTVTAQSAVTDVLFNLINNARVTTLGAYELVSSFAGVVLQKDGTITGAVSMLNKSFDYQSSSNVIWDMTHTGAAADTKKWRTVVSTTSRNRQAVSDAGSGTNYELVTRSGATITSVEWRGTLLYLNGTNTQIKLSTSATPANNSDMVFQRTSDTQFTIKVKGSDGIVRSANITLA